MVKSVFLFGFLFNYYEVFLSFHVSPNFQVSLNQPRPSLTKIPQKSEALCLQLPLRSFGLLLQPMLHWRYCVFVWKTTKAMQPPGVEQQWTPGQWPDRVISQRFNQTNTLWMDGLTDSQQLQIQKNPAEQCHIHPSILYFFISYRVTGEGSVTLREKKGKKKKYRKGVFVI